MAIFGDILSSASLGAANINEIAFARSLSLADNASAILPGASSCYAGTLGFAFVLNMQDTAMSIFALARQSIITYEVSDPLGKFSAASGTASSTNIYCAAAAPYNYTIENKMGASRTYQTFLLVDT